MDLAEAKIRAWSAPTLAAGRIQVFGESTKDYEDKVSQVARLVGNFYHQTWFSDSSTFDIEIEDLLSSEIEIIDAALMADLVGLIYTKQLTSNTYRRDIYAILDNWLQADKKVLEKKVTKEYSSIPEVKSIIVENSRNEKIFTIFTSSAVYDDQLMDILLTKEMQILEEFPKDTFSFRYIPFISENLYQSQISAKAKILFGE